MNTKKRLIISYEKLTKELLELFKEAYPEGYRNYTQKITKPDGSIMFVVPFETDDAIYMVKVNVEVDNASSESLDNILYGNDDDVDKDEEFGTINESDDDSKSNHIEKNINYGTEGLDAMMGGKKSRMTSDDDDDDDDDIDINMNEDEDVDEDDGCDDDREPSAEELAALEEEFGGTAGMGIGTGKGKKTSAKSTTKKSTAKSSTKKAAAAKTAGKTAAKKTKK